MLKDPQQGRGEHNISLSLSFRCKVRLTVSPRKKSHFMKLLSRYILTSDKDTESHFIYRKYKYLYIRKTKLYHLVFKSGHLKLSKCTKSCYLFGVLQTQQISTIEKLRKRKIFLEQHKLYVCMYSFPWQYFSVSYMHNANIERKILHTRRRQHAR